MSTKQKPLLSIIIPAYNCADKIGRLVNSILKQNFTDYELIIVNDKSTDNTGEVLKNIAKLDQRITIINQPKNGGASVARNTGINKSHGKYLMFFDADDDITKTTLAKFINTVSKNDNIELAVSGMTINNTRHGKIISSVNVCTNPLPGRNKNESFQLYILRLLGIDGRLYQIWNKIYLGSIIRNHNIRFQPGINFGEDLVFNLNYFSNMTGKIKFILEPLYIYDQALDSGTFSKSSLVYENRLANYAELVKFMDNEPNNTTKISLISWIQYSWLYSHLLAISLSTTTNKQKIANLRNVSNKFSFPPISDKKVVGSKKVVIEHFLSFIITKPRLALSVINLTQTLKNSRLTSGLWTKARQLINS